LVANFKLVKVSVKWASNGLAMTNMRVFELPPNEYCKRYVNYSLISMFSYIAREAPLTLEFL